MCLSFKAYTSRYGRFCTPCPKSTSQLIHHVFLLCKEAGQCGIYVSFKAYTSRYGRFACLVPNPPANSSIAFSCDAKKRGSAAYTFHLRHIHQGTDVLHALTQIHQPTHPSRFLAMQRKVSTAHMRFIQSIYIEVRIFGTPCPNPISQPIHHVFLRCKEAGQCGIYVSFKAYTSRYGYFACLDPNPPANSSIAFFAMQRKVSTAHVRFIQSIYIKVRILGTPCPTPISQSIRHVFWRCKEK